MSKNFTKIYADLQAINKTQDLRKRYDDSKSSPIPMQDNRFLLLKGLNDYIKVKQADPDSLKTFPIDWKHGPICDEQRKKSGVPTGGNCQRPVGIDDGTVLYVFNRTNSPYIDNIDTKFGFLDRCPSHPTPSMQKLNETGPEKQHAINLIHQDLEEISKSLQLLALTVTGHDVQEQLNNIRTKLQISTQKVAEMKTDNL
jgi:hypothetical protein